MRRRYGGAARAGMAVCSPSPLHPPPLSLPLLPLSLRSAALIESQLDHDERRDATIDSIRTAENGLYTFEVTQHEQTRTRAGGTAADPLRLRQRIGRTHSAAPHSRAPPLLLLLSSFDPPTASRVV